MYATAVPAVPSVELTHKALLAEFATANLALGGQGHTVGNPACPRKRPDSVGCPAGSVHMFSRPPGYSMRFDPVLLP